MVGGLVLPLRIPTASRVRAVGRQEPVQKARFLNSRVRRCERFAEPNFLNLLVEEAHQLKPRIRAAYASD